MANEQHLIKMLTEQNSVIQDLLNSTDCYCSENYAVFGLDAPEKCTVCVANSTLNYVKEELAKIEMERQASTIVRSSGRRINTGGAMVNTGTINQSGGTLYGGSVRGNINGGSDER